MHETDAADRESLEFLRNITDPSDQAESDMLTALKNLVPKLDQGKFGNLLIEHWLEYLKSRKISSAEFVKNLTGMVYATDNDDLALCCVWATNIFNLNNGYGFENLASMEPCQLHAEILGYR